MTQFHRHSAGSGLGAAALRARRPTPTRRRMSLKDSAPPNAMIEGAKPDQGDERLPVDPGVELSVRRDVGDAHIDLAEVQASQCRLPSGSILRDG